MASFSSAVRPAGKGVKPVVKGRIAYFTLQRPENLSIEFDDDPAQPAPVHPCDPQGHAGRDVLADHPGPGPILRSRSCISGRASMPASSICGRTPRSTSTAAMLKSPLMIEWRGERQGHQRRPVRRRRYADH
jgi:hypothetical protein